MVSWEHRGGRFQILTVEVYEHEVSVTWREHPLADPEQLDADALRAAERDVEGLPEGERIWHLERVRQRITMRGMPIESVDDDVGTEYRANGGGSGGGMHERRGYQDFRPGPPPEATRLTIGWQGRWIEVPLPSPGDPVPPA
jgi:hypothetical protein